MIPSCRYLFQVQVRSVNPQPLRKDWKNCLAVELLNQPIDGEEPPNILRVTSQDVVPLPYASIFKPSCEVHKLHVYEHASWQNKRDV